MERVSWAFGKYKPRHCGIFSALVSPKQGMDHYNSVHQVLGTAVRERRPGPKRVITEPLDDTRVVDDAVSRIGAPRDRWRSVSLGPRRFGPTQSRGRTRLHPSPDERQASHHLRPAARSCCGRPLVSLNVAVCGAQLWREESCYPSTGRAGHGLDRSFVATCVRPGRYWVGCRVCRRSSGLWSPSRVAAIGSLIVAMELSE